MNDGFNRLESRLESKIDKVDNRVDKINDESIPDLNRNNYDIKSLSGS